jgi:hypothetical protein
VLLCARVDVARHPRHALTALPCTALPCTALHCPALHCTALHCPPTLALPRQPSLPYTAPELVGGASLPGSAPLGGAASGAADVFSLALLAYELLQGQPLLSHVGSSSGAYRSTLPALPSADMSRVPAQLQPLLRGMLSTSAGSRPSAAAFASCPTFGEDVLLRCLRFLDSLLQRDAGQKVLTLPATAAAAATSDSSLCATVLCVVFSRCPLTHAACNCCIIALQIAFLGDLSTMWQQFDDRLLAGRVLPPVVGEMRAGGAVALAALPVVLGAMGRMAPAAFAASGILPALKPVFESADGEVLLALVRHLETFYKLLPRWVAWWTGHRDTRHIVTAHHRTAQYGATCA